MHVLRSFCPPWLDEFAYMEAIGSTRRLLMACDNYKLINRDLQKKGHIISMVLMEVGSDMPLVFT